MLVLLLTLRAFEPHALNVGTGQKKKKQEEEEKDDDDDDDYFDPFKRSREVRSARIAQTPAGSNGKAG
jgi:hypothetical protein